MFLGLGFPWFSLVFLFLGFPWVPLFSGFCLGFPGFPWVSWGFGFPFRFSWVSLGFPWVAEAVGTPRSRGPEVAQWVAEVVEELKACGFARASRAGSSGGAAR